MSQQDRRIVPGLERYANNPQEAGRYQQLYQQFHREFWSRLRSMPDETLTHLIDEAAMTSATAKMEIDAVNRKLDAAIEHEEFATRLRIQAALTPLSVREENQEFGGAIKLAGDTLRKSLGMDPNPHDYNLAHRFRGNSRYALFLQHMIEEGLVLHFTNPAWDGSLEINFGSLPEEDLQNYQAPHAHTMDFAAHLGFRNAHVGRRVGHPTQPFTLLAIPRMTGHELTDGVNIAHVSVDTTARDSVITHRQGR